MEVPAVIILIVGLVAMGLPVVLTVINIIQNGIGGYKGQTVESILGRPAAEASVADLMRLSKARLMQLFYAAPPPGVADLDGEYQAQLIPVGVLAGATAFYTHHFFGPGRWIGKAFKPLKNAAEQGYNLFNAGSPANQETVARTRSMRTYIGPSKIDREESLHLDYSPFNTGLVHTMHDEIRRINTDLYLGMGYMALGGGSINPAPFVVYGPAQLWVGPDADPDQAGA
jgi:hypothetical protein